MKRTALFLVALLVFSTPLHSANAPDFSEFQTVVDNYNDYSLEQRDSAIKKLQALKTDSLEKNYVLGMLNFIQGFDTMRTIARFYSSKPSFEEVLAKPKVKNYFNKAEKYYKLVAEKNPDYKHNYCKLAEVYSYAFNEKGIVAITRQVGEAPQTANIETCKKSIQKYALNFSNKGYAKLTKQVYITAIKYWQPYPDYMPEAIGDIEYKFGNPQNARSWWIRCVNEASTQRLNRCKHKLQQLNK